MPPTPASHPGPQAGQSLQDAIAAEETALRRVKFIVAAAIWRLKQGTLSDAEAVGLMAQTRSRVLEIFPDKGGTFDLIYLPRLIRAHQATRAIPHDKAGSVY